MWSVQLCRWAQCPHFWLMTQNYIDVIMSTMASQITSLRVVYSTVYSDASQRKHESSASLAFVWGIHRYRWIPRTKGQFHGKCFHLMTSSWKYISKNHKFDWVGNLDTKVAQIVICKQCKDTLHCVNYIIDFICTISVLDIHSYHMLWHLLYFINKENNKDVQSFVEGTNVFLISLYCLSPCLYNKSF